MHAGTFFQDRLNFVTREYFAKKPKSYAKGAVPENTLRFDLGESVVGPSPKVMPLLETLSPVTLSEYPDHAGTRLKSKIAEIFGDSSENITVANAGDELIELIARVFIEPHDTVIIPVPTFFRFEDATLRAGGIPYFIHMQNLEFDEKSTQTIVKTAKERNAKIIWLCNPNNPLGNAIDLQFIEEIAKGVPTSLVVVDEVYGAFLDEEGKINSAVCLLKEFKNVFTIRSLSKTHGLASLRIGFGIGDKNLIRILEDYRLPFVMNGIAQKVAAMALDDEEHLEKVRSLTKLWRNQLEKEFQKIEGLEFLSSCTNTILVRHSEKMLFDELLKRKILVADLSTTTGLEGKNYVRITVKSEEENKQLVLALSQICNE